RRSWRGSNGCTRTRTSAFGRRKTAICSKKASRLRAACSCTPSGKPRVRKGPSTIPGAADRGREKRRKAPGRIGRKETPKTGDRASPSGGRFPRRSQPTVRLAERPRWVSSFFRVLPGAFFHDHSLSDRVVFPKHFLR